MRLVALGVLAVGCAKHDPPIANKTAAPQQSAVCQLVTQIVAASGDGFVALRGPPLEAAQPTLLGKPVGSPTLRWRSTVSVPNAEAIVADAGTLRTWTATWSPEDPMAEYAKRARDVRRCPAVVRWNVVDGASQIVFHEDPVTVSLGVGEHTVELVVSRP